MDMNVEEIKELIKKTNDILRPVYLFCNPKHYDYFHKELSGSIYDVVSSVNIEEDKIYIMNKADTMLPFENSDLPRVDLSFLDQLINKDGEK